MAVVIACALGLVTRAANADPTEPIRIKLDAPKGCPDAAQLAGEVRARTARARLADKDELARTFEVTIARKGKTKRVGTLRIQDTSGATDVREVEGATCAEVVSALALIAALAIDPHASTAAKVDAIPAVVPPGGTQVTTQPRLELVPIPFHLPWWSGVGPNPGMPLLRFGWTDWWSAPMTDPLPVIPIEPTPHVVFAAGAHVGGASGVGPTFAPTITPFVEATYEQRGLVVPSARLAFVASLPVNASGGAIVASRFELFAGRLDACPIRFDLASFVDVRPCAAFTAGAVRASGQGVAPPGKTSLETSVTSGWAEASVLARLAAHAGAFGFELQGGFGVPFVRTNYKVLPDRAEAFSVPAATGSVSAGASLQFP